MVKSRLRKLATISLVFTFLVMLAGSVVRMTGSGMGCPDWPKCFGYYIPPTDISTLIWSPNRAFKKGQVIIYNEGLLVASADFTTAETFDPAQWQPYTKHDYAIFNATHTWIEFINRLLGALMGIPVLMLFFFSIRYFQKDPLVSILSTAGLVLLGFEAWLGKMVVDGNLIPNRISLHMFGALGLVAVFTFLMVRLNPTAFTFKPRRDRLIIGSGFIGVALLLIQIFLGTAVREVVDEVGKPALIAAIDWPESMGINFIIHRSFSLIVLAILGYFAVRLIRTRIVSTWPRVLLAFLAIEVVFGVCMAYFELPAIFQPLHLIFAAFLFALAFGLVAVYWKKTENMA